MVEDEHFNIVVSDIEMPEMNGLDLLRKIKDHNGMIQVIIMTSFIKVNNTLNAFRYGASDLIFKPFDPLEIVDAVHEHIQPLQGYTSQRNCSNPEHIRRSREGV